MAAYQMVKKAPVRVLPVIAAGTVAFFALGALGAVLVPDLVPFINRPLEPARHTSSKCLVGTALNAHKIFVLDLTDPLSESTWQETREKIEASRDSLPANGKLTIVRIDPSNPFKPLELFSKCVTPKPSGQDTWTETASYEMRAWREEYAMPLTKIITESATVPSAEPSPILETITALTWRGDFRADVKERQLILVSDLVQHDPHGYSHLRNGTSWTSYTQSRQFNEAKPDLRGVQVVVLYVNRPIWRALQNANHIKFWQRAFNRFGTQAEFIGGPTNVPEHVAPTGGPHIKNKAMPSVASPRKKHTRSLCPSMPRFTGIDPATGKCSERQPFETWGSSAEHLLP
jgi:hypothetical protein